MDLTKIFKRILELKKVKGYTWNELAKKANIPVSSWMTGLPTMIPTDKELMAIAPVLDTTFEYLKYGK